MASTQRGRCHFFQTIHADQFDSAFGVVGSNLVLLQLLPNHMANGFFNGHSLNGVLRRLVDERLIAAFASLGLEVLDDGAIQINIHPLLRG